MLVICNKLQAQKTANNNDFSRVPYSLCAKDQYLATSTYSLTIKTLLSLAIELHLPCWPELVPHKTGDPLLAPALTVNESEMQSPIAPPDP